VNAVRLTHIGGPTLLIEVGPWRLLTDPTFDDPGRTYSFGWGSSSRKQTPPAVPAQAVGPLDAILLSHHHHADNLDDAGRALLPSAARVLTTETGARALGGNARPLSIWNTTELQAPGRPSIRITATPCRHGPPGFHPIVGDVIGFCLEWDGQRHGALWISGDTVLFRGVRDIARRFTIGTAILHLGKVRFPVTGPLRYTMTAREAIEVCRLVQPHCMIPVHYEGWSHFHQGRDAIEAEFSRAPAAVQQSVRWLAPGMNLEIDV
jgi:L-ascorbate metabolism protein UlaG (beta-lactamase superfamily)